MSKKDQLHEFGINVIDLKDDATLVQNMLNKIRDSDFRVMNLNQDIADKCTLKGRVIEGEKGGKIEEIKIESKLPSVETNCVFLGARDSDKDDFIQKVFEEPNEEEEAFLDSLKCNRIEYYPGALETLSDIDNTQVTFLNKGACNMQIQQHFKENL